MLFLFGLHLCLRIGIVTTLAGATTAGTADGTGTNAKFSGPLNLVVDPYGLNLYIGDGSNNMIRVLAISTGILD